MTICCKLTRFNNNCLEYHNQDKKKGAQSLVLLPIMIDYSIYLFNDVFAFVGLAGGEGQFQEVTAGDGRGGYAQRIGVASVGPDLVVIVAGDGGVDVGDGGIGIDVHYSSDVVAVRCLGAVAEAGPTTGICIRVRYDGNVIGSVCPYAGNGSGGWIGIRQRFDRWNIVTLGSNARSGIWNG